MGGPAPRPPRALESGRWRVIYRGATPSTTVRIRTRCRRNTLPPRGGDRGPSRFALFFLANKKVVICRIGPPHSLPPFCGTSRGRLLGPPAPLRAVAGEFFTGAQLLYPLGIGPRTLSTDPPETIPKFKNCPPAGVDRISPRPPSRNAGPLSLAYGAPALARGAVSNRAPICARRTPVAARW